MSDCDAVEIHINVQFIQVESQNTEMFHVKQQLVALNAHFTRLLGYIV